MAKNKTRQSAQQAPQDDPNAAWQARIDAARTRRQKYESIWALFARMHTDGYRAVQDKNDDQWVTFPNGDQIKAALIFRNIEQTLAVTDVPEIGVRATATDYTRELGAEDTHRESVVEQALYRSVSRSGLVKGSEESDPVRRDGFIIGHGINYSHWRVIEREVETGRVAVLQEGEDGAFAPVLDGGAPAFEPLTERRVVWEGAQDEHVSPREFLFDAAAKRFEKAGWHGYERPVKLAELRSDPRYHIPEDLAGTTFTIKDIYLQESGEGEELTDAVMVIVIWDKLEQVLLTFIEDTAPGQHGPARERTADKQHSLIEIGREPWPLTFSHPDDSPFRFFVPIPANDHPFGISQIEHVRNQAFEADKLRTRQANITRQIKRIVWYRKGRLDHDQLTEAMRADDLTPVGLDIQEGEKPESLMGELPTPSVSPDIYRQYIDAERGVDKTSGISDVPGGGADTATEAEHIFEIGGARAKRKKRLYLKFLTEVGRCHFDFLREWCPEGEIIVVPDVDGRPLTLAYGREAFQGEFEIEVVAGGGAMSLSPVRQKLLNEAAQQMFNKFGPQFDRVLLRQLLTMFDFRGVNELMRAAQAGMPMPPMLPGALAPAGDALQNYSTPQTIRAGANAVHE